MIGILIFLLQHAMFRALGLQVHTMQLQMEMTESNGKSLRGQICVNEISLCCISTRNIHPPRHANFATQNGSFSLLSDLAGGLIHRADVLSPAVMQIKVIN